jgi:protein TonB
LNLRSTIIGIAASAILLAVLGVARLFTTQPIAPDLIIRDVETVIFQPPPPAPPIEEPPSDSPPPPPALTEVSSLPDPTRVPVPQAKIPMDITAPVENFFTDLAPAPLPVAPTDGNTRPKISTPTQTTLPPVEKTHYSSSELDDIPRLLSHGLTTFPSSLANKGVKRGTVTFEVELSSTGSVKIRRVISSTHPELVEPARNVALSARFTPPKRKGQAVKAIMQWPIVIEK